MVNRKTVAEMAGVSTATVTRVTSGKGYVSEEARLKVEEAIKKLNYRPNQLAQNLRMQRNNAIAVIAEDIVNPYNSELIERMSFEARQRGYVISLFLLTEYEREGGMQEIIDEICANRFAGVINMTLNSYEEKDIERLRSLNIPISLSVTPIMRLDYEPPMREAYKILQEKGRKRIAFLSGAPSRFTGWDERYVSYCKLNKEFGMAEDENLILYGDYPKQQYFNFGYEAIHKLMKEKVEFDAIFCLTDIIVAGVINGLNEYGKRVPDDILIFSCDNIQLAPMLIPPLTTIDTNRKAIAEVYIKYILGLEQEYPVKITSRLIRRQSL